MLLRNPTGIRHKRFPYLLPNVAGACLALLTMILVWLVLPASREMGDENNANSPTSTDAVHKNYRCTSSKIDHAEDTPQTKPGRGAYELVAAGATCWGSEMDQLATLPMDTTNEFYSSRGGDDPSRHDKPVGLLGLRRVRTLLIMFTILSVRSALCCACLHYVVRTVRSTNYESSSLHSVQVARESYTLYSPCVL